MAASSSSSTSLQYSWDSGVSKSIETIVNILSCVRGEASLSDLEDDCKKVLIENGQRVFVTTHEQVKLATNNARKKEGDKNVLDAIKDKAKNLKDKTANSLNDNIISALTPTQIKNNAMRFGSEDTSASHKSIWPFSGKSVFSSGEQSRDYDDVISPEVIAAPICDICIIEGGEPVPEGFYRIFKTPSNKKANLNASSNGDSLFLCIKKDVHGRYNPITSLVVIFPSMNEFLPVGYDTVRKNRLTCNINQSSDPDVKTRIFIGYKKEKQGNPITDVQIIFPEKNEETPRCFNCVARTPTGIDADLNTGTSGWKTFLTYKQTAVKLLPLIRDSAAEKALLQHAHSLESDSRESLSSGRASLGNKQDSTRGKLSLSPNISAAKSGGGGPNRSWSDSSGGDKEDINDETDETTSVFSEASMISSSSDDINDCNFSETLLLTGDGSEISSRVKRLMHVLLSALYVRHDKIPRLAISGLVKLLKETNFFEADFNSSHNSTSHSQHNQHLHFVRRVTLLDLTVSVISDRFDMCNEKEFDDLLQFIRTLVQYSNGVLSLVILQKIYRILSYLFTYFSTNPAWNIKCYSNPLSESKEELPVLKVLKDLIWTLQAQIEKVEIAHFLSMPGINTDVVFAKLPNYKEESVAIVQDLVRSFVDDIVESVELSTTAESIIVIMNKQTETVYKNVFWQDVGQISKHLFVDISYRILFIALCAILKSCWQPVRNNNKNTGLKDSDFGSKLLALEALIYFCEGAGEKLFLSKIMGYVVRRVVVSCILYNVKYMFLDHRIFQKLMKLMSSLWKNWRMHIRIEFAVLCETLVIRMLQAPTACIRPIYQLVVFQEAANWFHQPYLLAEMFVNYDVDTKFVSNWNIFSHLIRGICALARKTSITSKIMDSKVSYSTLGNAESNKYTNKDKHFNAISNVTKVAKTLMDSACHAHFKVLKSQQNADSGGVGGSAQFGGSTSPSSPSSEGTPDSAGRHSPDKFIQNSSSQKQHNEDLVTQAIKIYKEKDSIKKAVGYLVANGYMPDTPAEIVHFLRFYKSSFDPTALGDYLGEGGHPEKIEEIEYWNQVRFRYIRAVSFLEKDVDVALRLLLTGCGFRLPGEAQKIDRLIETFSKIWFQDNYGTKHCPFYSPDTVHILCFAIIMLNTDLHKAANEQQKGKKFKKMTVEQFIANLRGINNNQNLSPIYLTRIYDNIAANQISMKFETNEKQSQSAEASSQQPKKSGLLSTLAAIPKLLKPKNSEDVSSEADFIGEVTAAAQEAGDLLRSVAPFSYRYLMTGIDTILSHDLITLVYENVWFHFYSIGESLFDSVKKVDINIVFCALDILGYSITTCMFLKMDVIKKQFADLLLAYREAFEPAKSHPGRQVVSDSWYEETINATVETALECSAKVYRLVVYLKDSIYKLTNQEITLAIAAKIEKKSRVMESNTFFIREGDLMKRDRLGKLTTYHFFLFSDELLYCHIDKSTGEYKVHGQFNLQSLTVSDVGSDTSERSFYINHPIKSFVVLAPDPDTKNGWIKDLHDASIACIKRLMSVSSGPIERRMSMVSRIADQKSNETKQRDSVRFNIGNTTSPERPTKIMSDMKIDMSNVSPLKLNYETSHGSIITGEEVPVSLVNSDSSSPVHAATSCTNTPFNSASAAAPDRTEDTFATSTPPASPSTSSSSSSSFLSSSAAEVVIAPPQPPQPTTEVKPLALSAKELARKQAVDKLNSVLQTANTAQLDSVFNAGVQFWKGMNTAEPAKSILLNMFNECKQEGYMPGLPATAVGITGKRVDNDDKEEEEDDEEDEEDELSASSLSMRKKDFLVLLITYYSYWKYDQYL